MNDRLLNEDEKYLWLWLATQGADNDQYTCSFSYEQISTAVNKSLTLIHRSLFRFELKNAD